MQFLRAVTEKIYIVGGAAIELRKIQSHAPSDVTCESLIAEVVAMIRDVTEFSPESYRAVVLE
jgi:hypothetical protein